MKKLALLFTVAILIGTSVSAKTTAAAKNNSYNKSYINGYGDSFIFTEGGIEFSVFRDGQFDFYVPSYGPGANISINTPNVSFSFNSGYDYNAYVQYDDYGAIIQVENIPIYYDYYGRIIQAGNVNIHYNNYGRVSRVGSLYVHYDRYHNFSHYTGYINVYNRVYVQRPWHRYYAIPARDYCVVYARPYRQYYKPVRHHYYRPYANNYRMPVRYTPHRQNSLSSGRRNGVATNIRTSDRYRQEASPGRRSSNVGIRTVDAGKRSTNARRTTELSRVNRSTSGNLSRQTSAKNVQPNSNERLATRTRSNERASHGNVIKSTSNSNTRTRSTTRTSRDNTGKASNITRGQVVKSAPSSSRGNGDFNKNAVRRQPNSANSRTYNKERSANLNTRPVQKRSESNTQANRQASSSRSRSIQSRGN